MSNEQNPITAHVDEYVKTLSWTPDATEHEKTLVIGNLRGFASHLAAIENGADILDDPRVDKEIRRWQDAIRDKLIELGAPDWKIDGAGCDSGDPLDFTLAEVGQGCGFFIDKAEDAATQMRTACVETIRALRPSATGAGAFKDAAIKALGAVTLDQVKQKEQSK